MFGQAGVDGRPIGRGESRIEGEVVTLPVERPALLAPEEIDFGDPIGTNQGMTAIDDFRSKWADITAIGSAAAVLNWDQEIYMPPKGAQARGGQIATLSGIAHEKSVFVLPEKYAANSAELHPTRRGV